MLGCAWPDTLCDISGVAGKGWGVVRVVSISGTVGV